jgi:hypothetical protein
MKLINKYLNEATIAANAPDFGGIAGGPDDFPVQMGQKFIKKPYFNKLTGYDKTWRVDHSEWKWDEFQASKGAEDPKSYSKTLLKLKDVIPDFNFYHRLRRKVPDKLVAAQYNRTPHTIDPDKRLGKDDVEVMRVPDDIKENKIINKYLNETTISANYPDFGGIAGDDDFPPGNIVFGQKNKKVPYFNKLTGYNKVWDVDDSEWTWDEFENSKGMEDPNNYSETLKSLGDIIPKFDFFHRLKKSVPDKDVEDNYDRTPQTKDPDTQLKKDDVETIEVPDDIKERIELYLK